MTNKEAIARIREHKIIHKMDEPRAIYISEALDMGIKALKNQKTGHWKKISHAGIMECSVCGENVLTSDIEAYKYCHHCGAKMEGENKKECSTCKSDNSHENCLGCIEYGHWELKGE